MLNFFDNILISMTGPLEGWNGTLTELGNSFPSLLGCLFDSKYDSNSYKEHLRDLYRTPCLLDDLNSANQTYKSLYKNHPANYLQGQWTGEIVTASLVTIPLKNLYPEATESWYRRLGLNYRNSNNQMCGFSIVALHENEKLGIKNDFLVCVLKNVIGAWADIDCSLFTTSSCLNRIRSSEKLTKQTRASMELSNCEPSLAFKTTKRVLCQLYNTLECDALKAIVKHLFNNDNTVNHRVFEDFETALGNSGAISIDENTVCIDSRIETSRFSLLGTTFSAVSSKLSETMTAPKQTLDRKRSLNSTLPRVLVPTTITGGSGIIGASKLGATLASTKAGAAIGTILGHGICSLPGAIIGACLGLVFSLISVVIYVVINKLGSTTHTKDESIILADNNTRMNQRSG